MEEEKIFCIGLSRTGTTSVCEALKMLDIPTLHYIPSIFTNPQIIDSSLRFSPQVKRTPYQTWRLKKELKVYNEERAVKHLINYRAFGDLPIPLFYKELDTAFPKSKFIYTTRDIDSWLRSMKWMLTEGKIIWKWGNIDHEILFRTYNTQYFEKDKLVHAFEEHQKDVFNYFNRFSNEKLLIMNIDEERLSFKKICNFFSLPIPLQDYPQSNKKRDASIKEKLEYFTSKNIPLHFPLKKLNFSKKGKTDET